MHEAPTATDRTSAHARYRDRLARLQDDEALRDVLVSAGLPGDAGWRRTHGRFLPGGAPYATLLLEAADPQRLVSLACFVDESVPVGADRTTVRAPGLGWVRVDSFPSDAALTTLGTVWTPEAPCRVMRYRPGKRCTLRFDGPGGPTFVKVFADDSGAVLQEDARRLWRAARAGRLGFEMPEPLGWDATRRALSQKAVPGSPLLTRLGAATGGELAEAMGRALATLVRAGATPSLRFDADVQRARSRRYLAEIASRVPAAAAAADAFLARLDTAHAALEPRPLVPIHGAPHVNQWLLDGDRLGLVDFDRFSMGDPELDVATFLGELDFEDGFESRLDEVSGRFTEGYESVAWPLDRARLRLYRVHKRLAKALRSARSLRPDGDARTLRHLATALDAWTLSGAAA
ncbi:MAG: phosphotransferase [Vicinamibacterales bacterium]